MRTILCPSLKGSPSSLPALTGLLHMSPRQCSNWLFLQQNLPGFKDFDTFFLIMSSGSIINSPRILCYFICGSPKKDRGRLKEKDGCDHPLTEAISYRHITWLLVGDFLRLKWRDDKKWRRQSSERGLFCQFFLILLEMKRKKAKFASRLVDSHWEERRKRELISLLCCLCHCHPHLFWYDDALFSSPSSLS